MAQNIFRPNLVKRDFDSDRDTDLGADSEASFLVFKDEATLQVLFTLHGSSMIVSGTLMFSDPRLPSMLRKMADTIEKGGAA